MAVRTTITTNTQNPIRACPPTLPNLRRYPRLPHQIYSLNSSLILPSKHEKLKLEDVHWIV
jgi:hypothetical protein